MSERVPFNYAVVRVVPRVERGEFINVGVIVFSRPRRYLGVRLVEDLARLRAFAPDADSEAIAAHLNFLQVVVKGGKDSGPIGALPLAERFHWLVAPRSTVIQCSPSHTGLCHDPARELEKLFGEMVL